MNLRLDVPRLFFGGLETEAYLLHHAFAYDHHTTLSAIMLSIQCLLILHKVNPADRSGRRGVHVAYDL